MKCCAVPSQQRCLRVDVTDVDGGCEGEGVNTPWDPGVPHLHISPNTKHTHTTLTHHTHTVHTQTCRILWSCLVHTAACAR